MSMYIAVQGPLEVKGNAGEVVPIPAGKWIMVYDSQETGRIVALSTPEGLPVQFDSEEAAGEALMGALEEVRTERAPPSSR